jgi:hypothetical protein
MNHKSVNNGNRQNTISIVTRSQVVKPMELASTPRKVTIFSLALNIPIEYDAHTARSSVGVGYKGLGIETINFLLPR